VSAGAVYVLVGVVASAAVPTGTLARSSGPLLEVVKEAGGVPPKLFSAIALVAVANGALLTGIMSSRLAYGMARDGLLPRFLTRVLPRRRTPWASIAVTTALSFLLALTGDVATARPIPTSGRTPPYPSWERSPAWCSPRGSRPRSGPAG
jgi:amino acid transporter